jgi:hypothetical protein
MFKRADVYEAIDEERAYQKRMWDDAQHAAGDDRPLSIGEEILLAQEYLDRARHAWSIAKRPELKALDRIRKAAAILVHAMEYHGIVYRDKVQPTALDNQATIEHGATVPFKYNMHSTTLPRD